jgi:hypothetical protein
MAGITGITNTFNAPNYHGELFALTPTDTPLLSMAGGIGGGKQTTSIEFEWQTYDLRDPEIRPRLEGADAPNPEARIRANVKGVVQIFHEAVGTTYTKSATAQQLATSGAVNTADGLGVGNPVTNEHAWQVTQALTQIARDTNYAFWHGKKNVPIDNTTARQTAGLLSMIQTNRVMNPGVAEVTASTATDTVTANAHGLAAGDQVVFTSVDAATGIRLDRSYFVLAPTTNTFKVSSVAGGAAITLGTAAPKFVPVAQAANGANKYVTVDGINAFVQQIFDNGGLAQGGTRTLFVPSIQKTAITKAYALSYGKNYDAALGSPTGHTVGGVAVDRIMTDFGELNIVVERALPKDAIVAVSMEQVDPVFLSIPGKGVLFEEELAKTGATDKTQIYGEIGLKWGNERSHGVLRGLPVVVAPNPA